MTLLIYKEPFEKTSQILLGILCLIPLALIVLVPIFWITGHELIAMFSIAQATCFPIFSYGWLKTMNEKYHWCGWKSHNSKSVEGKKE